MRVGIFETTHFEGAYPVIRLFDNGVNEIIIFTYEESYHQFQFLFGEEMRKFRWILRKKEESKFQFIRRIYKETKSLQLELLYLNTITDNYIFYSWMISSLKDVRIIMTLHSINNYFEHKAALSLRRIIRTIGKKRLMHVINEFNVVALTMVDYLKERLPPHKKVHCVPGAVYESRTDASMNLPGRKISELVVPGMVDHRRRDYDLVIALAERMKREGMDFTLTILGGIHPLFGIAVLGKIKKSDSQGQLKYYEIPVVDQPEFDRVMDESDLVLLPSTIHNTILDDIPEVYGISMSSGNLFDIIKHAKPFLVPRGLRVDPFLEESCLRYDSLDEIVEILSALRNSPHVYASLVSKARTASTNYSIEAVRKRNPDLFP